MVLTLVRAYIGDKRTIDMTNGISQSRRARSPLFATMSMCLIHPRTVVPGPLIALNRERR